MSKMTRRVTPQQTEQLLRWMQQYQPRIYTGLVRRFTPKGEMSGFWDGLTKIGSSVVSGVTNFVNSQGVASLLTAAQPFIQSRLEKEQLELNIQRMQSGQPIVQYAPPVGASVAIPTTGAAYDWVPSSGSGEIPWGWIAGGAGVLLLLMRR